MRLRTARTTGAASGSVSHGSSSHGVSGPNSQVHRRAAGRRRRRSPRTAIRVRSRPSRTASVRLPARRSVSMSRTLLTTRIARGQQPDRHRERERLPAEVLDLDEVGAGDGDDPEEQEHEHLAEPLVAVRSRAAGVEHAGEDRGGADEQQLASRRPRSGRCRRAPRCRTRRTSRPAPAAGGTSPPAVTRTGPEAVLGVGAAARVGVVVGEVRADLDEDRADQRREEAQRVEDVRVAGQRGADQHRRDRGRQRPRRRAAISQMRAPPLGGSVAGGRPSRLRPAGTSRSRAGASRGTRCGPPAPPRSCRRAGSRRGRAAGCPARPSSSALKLAFSSRSANGDSASISRHQRDGLGLELVERHDRVDEPHLERLLRVVLAAQEPDLLGLLRADEPRRGRSRRSRRRTIRPSGPVWPKRALSAAIVRSQMTCSTWPPPIA